MNTLLLIPMLLSLIPAIVQAIETAADDNLSGAEKKAKALEAVQLSATVAMGIDPSDTVLIQTCTKLASPMIDAFVAVYKLRGLFKSKKALPATT